MQKIDLSLYGQSISSLILYFKHNQKIQSKSIFHLSKICPCIQKVCLEIRLILSKEKADFPCFYQENRPYERAGIRTRDNLIKSQVLYRLSYTPISYIIL